MIRSEGNADRWTDRASGPISATLAAVLMVSTGAGHAAAQEKPVAAPTSDTVVVLEADTLVRDENADTITAEGNVEARYEGRTLRTKRLVYDLKEHTIRAQGGVEIVDPDGTVRYSEEIEVDEQLNTGFATGFASRMVGGGVAVASAAVRPSEGRNELRRFVYTACPICKVEGTDKTKGPTWTLRARNAVQDQNSKMISYRDVVLQFGPVPVVYLPYFAHPDPSSGPRSGFLAPDIGTNRRVGGFYKQPYYWRMSPSQDLTVAPQISNKVNPLVEMAYRKEFFSGSVRANGSFAYDQNFDGNGDKFGNEDLRGHLFADGIFKVNDWATWGFGIERSADDLYLRRYDIFQDARTRGPYVGDNTRLISQLYAIGQTPNTYSSVSLVSFQGLSTIDEASTPLILPVAQFDHVRRDPWLGGQLRLKASTASLYRSENTGVDSSRVSAGFTWRRDRIFGPGIVLAPFAESRADFYRINNATAGGSETFGRGLGIAGVEASWPLLRPGRSVDLIVEPVAMAAIGSNGGNDPRIVNEDGLAFELDDSNLFRPSAAPNYDLWEPGPRLSAGLRATARDHQNRSASLLVGRRWRDKAEPAFSQTTNLAGTKSDWVTAASVNLGSNFAGELRGRFSEKDLSLVRLDAQIRASVWRISTDARYFEVNKSLRPTDPSREIRAGAAFRLTDNWSTSYALQRDLDSDITLSQNVHVVYRDNCTFLDLAYVRSETFNRVLGPNEGFQIRIGLSSLGVFGGGD